MDRIAEFNKHIKQGYDFDNSIILGTAQLGGKPVTGAHVCLPLKTFNRHGLIAGATGTGKTKTIQLLAENLSDNGVSVLLMDLKGDLSGLAESGKHKDFILDRHGAIGIEYQPKSYPIELLSLSKTHGIKLRATISEFGPLLFSKILGLNETQASIVNIIFKYCDDNKLPLLDIKDFKRVLQHIVYEISEEVSKAYGQISKNSAGAIQRKIIELETQGGDSFFGEPSFDVEDLMRLDNDGAGYISILTLADIQDRPKLFSSFMLCLLAELYSTLPEVGDTDKPKIVLFIDEAHLIFKDATKELLAQIEQVVKLIRSKSVGVFLCTQAPTDIPNNILNQLGLKVQHALRAFTAKDRKNIKLIAENYPASDYYDTSKIITSLGVGEALVTGLNPKGIPTPLASTLLCAPRSQMGPISDSYRTNLVAKSNIHDKYNHEIDRDSAFEILERKINQGKKQIETKSNSKMRTGKKGFWNKLFSSTLGRQIGRTVAREVTRGLLGILGIKRR